MAILKKEYELSIWGETLGDNGQKVEKKEYIIGSHDMTYLGKATKVKLKTYLKGTHELTFQMVDRFFDNEQGDYVRNEFIEQMFNEKKVKLKYKNKWYEFYIKSVKDSKNFKSYIKEFTCQDAFIDELSRNGYGLTFDEELYNNVEEFGTFTEEILDDSIWTYSPQYNWGDFTEFLEEKMFKIPVKQFGEKLLAYKLNFEVEVDDDLKIINKFTNKKRKLEISDDLARLNNIFWDQQSDKETKNQLLNSDLMEVENDGYIYVFVSQLSFCYANDKDTNSTFKATQSPQSYGNKSYALAPSTVDPNSLIQFLAIPKNAEVEIDEKGLILNKNYHYVMTVKQWNDYLKDKQDGYFYQFENSSNVNRIKKFYSYNELQSSESEIEQTSEAMREITGNWCAYYEGYLNKIGDLDATYGKKIVISNRTEINISDEIDQYVKVYNQHYLNNTFSYIINPDWIEDNNSNIDYRICSKTETRQIVPQLAKNLLTNSYNMTSIDGWEIMERSDVLGYSSAKIQLAQKIINKDETQVVNNNYIEMLPMGYEQKTKTGATVNNNTFINFGIVGQGEKIEANQTYCLIIKGKFFNGDVFIIGEGMLKTDGNYSIKGVEKDFQNNLNKKDYLEWRFHFFKNGVSISDIENSMTLSNIEKIEEKTYCLLFSMPETIENPYFALRQDFGADEIYVENENDETQKGLIKRSFSEIRLFKAYTKGIDFFPDENINGQIKQNAYFLYSGRDILINQILDDDTSDLKELRGEKIKEKRNSWWWIPEGFKFKDFSLLGIDELRKYILFEDDIMPGDTYSYEKYFVQQIVGENNNVSYVADSFKAKQYLSPDATEIEAGIDYSTNISYRNLPYSSKDFTENDIKVNTRYIDLNSCQYYSGNTPRTQNCCYGGTTDNPTKFCMYQKYGYCPYQFQTEKHCRKIRTLKQSKSNRFNLTQEVSKIFEIYPIYYTEHTTNGKIKKDENDKMIKELFYITEKGKENKLGFRYEKNLKNISRTIKSDKITTKLYVQDVDSQISPTGLCSIKTAEDNISKDSFIINFSYYIAKGIMKEEDVENDLYGTNVDTDWGYLKRLGYLNSEYDKISNIIIDISSSSFTELEANLEVNLNAILTSQKQIAKIKKQMDKFKTSTSVSANETYNNYQNQLNEQTGILNGLIKDTFYGENVSLFIGLSFDKLLNNYSIDNIRALDEVKKHTYTDGGILGQYNKEYQQIQKLRKQQASLLKDINELSLKFFRKYEPYLKEGTWSDSNYISDNAYYLGAQEVAADGAIPKVEYSINVIDISKIPDNEIYEVDNGDTSYIEDIGMFGINPKTGLPNRLKVIVSGIDYDLDQPENDSIQIQNYTTQFEDLFQQVSASVQSLSFNENIYKRSSNFTSNQNIEEDSLQGTLDQNKLTLVNTSENNIKLDQYGQSGSDINNHSNKYKLNGEGLFFSNNGGQSWNVGVGPSGINADYIKVGTLDAGKIRIMDNDYVYFFWDKSGLKALQEPTPSSSTINNTYVSFNRYGLSLVENDKLRLRAGYGLLNGKNSTTTTPGFFLYDENKRTIFSTNANNNTARLNLSGEMVAYTPTQYPNDGSNTYYNYRSGWAYQYLSEPIRVYKVGDIPLMIDNTVNIEDYMEQDNNYNEEIRYVNSLSSIPQDMVILKSYIYKLKNDTSITNRYIKRVDNTFVEFLETNFVEYSYVRKNEISDKITTEEINPIGFYGDNGYYRTNENILKYFGKDYYLFAENNNIYSFYENRVLINNDNNSELVAVYLNNELDASQKAGKITRIFSCVSGTNSTRGSFNNLITILSDGTLQIGGLLNVSDNSSIESLPPECTLTGEDGKIIRVKDGQLTFSGQNLSEAINEAKNYLPRHRHYLKSVVITLPPLHLVEEGEGDNKKITGVVYEQLDPGDLTSGWGKADFHLNYVNGQDIETTETGN